MANNTNYTQGYSKATLASHTSRTVEFDASFLIPYIKPTDNILDVGCGPGTITFQKADLLSAERLPFPDNTFDIVFNSQLFPHLPTHSLRIQALAEMHRVLKPGGILASRDAAELNFYPIPLANLPEAKYDLNRL